MSKIILIETSTSLCSAAISEDGAITAYKELGGRQHASMLAPMLQDILKERGLSVKDCDAVAVSKGPGSYTGLRVGASTAKGLCFASGLPLIAVGSLDALVWEAIEGGMLPEGYKYIVPMIDARRMEVYTALFDTKGEQLTPTEAKVIDKDSFAAERSQGSILFIGDGAEKCASLLGEEGCIYIDRSPDARGMRRPAEELFEKGKFEDVAYFEPFYLKDFVATVSHKNDFLKH